MQQVHNSITRGNFWSSDKRYELIGSPMQMQREICIPHLSCLWYSEEQDIMGALAAYREGNIRGVPDCKIGQLMVEKNVFLSLVHRSHRNVLQKQELVGHL
mmetsp:Transcript_15873/g.17744  ORF Transcript_15873/g.17744 Transcript_15873/m.17744 type:complete len:101 (-) Transcript_15873:5021-5323(-)